MILGFCGRGRGFQGVEAFSQRDFFIAPAIVPRAPLKAHDERVLADKMRAGARLEQCAIGGVWSQIAQWLGVCDTGTCKARIRGGAEVRDRRDGIIWIRFVGRPGVAGRRTAGRRIA